METLEIVIAKLLKESGKTISFAESCTGGSLSKLFSSMAGASAYFKGGIITYSTQSKIDILGVSLQTIERYSVVSEEVALEMAINARQKFKTDYAISTTGNAGPSKGDSEADIGTVFIGISTPEGDCVKKYLFDKPREEVVEFAVLNSLKLILKKIFKK